MNDELEMTRKEAVLSKSRNYPEICMEVLRKSTKILIRIVSVPV
jgi:hypothetical protein